MIIIQQNYSLVEAEINTCKELDSYNSQSCSSSDSSLSRTELLTHQYPELLTRPELLTPQCPQLLTHQCPELLTHQCSALLTPQ